jgi:hypothetical protein
MATKKIWFSVIPTECETCGDQITDRFVDGMTKYGPWAVMCPGCWKDGIGIGGAYGNGRGQLYKKAEDGKFYKVEG